MDKQQARLKERFGFPALVALAALSGFAVFPLLERALPAKPSIMFHGPAIPQTILPGKKARVHFADVERTDSCGARVYPRWRADLDGQPGDLLTGADYPSEPFDAVPAPPGRIEDFRATLPFKPPHDHTRVWYHPNIVPNPSCRSKVTVTPPPALMIIVDKDT